MGKYALKWNSKKSRRKMAAAGIDGIDM